MLILLLACFVQPDPAMRGRILDGPDAAASAIENGTVRIREQFGEEFATTTSSIDGDFEVTIPANQMFFMEVSGDGFIPTTFTGLAGTEDLEVADGELWARSAEDLSQLAETFSECPDAMDEGAVVEGEVRLYLGTSNDYEELPIVTTATVSAIDAEGLTWDACYLDDDGASTSKASATGETGRFALFGLPAGFTTIEIQYDYGGTSDEVVAHYFYLPEEGTAPMYPALTLLPGT